MSYNLLIDGEVVGPVDVIEAILEDGSTQRFKVPKLNTMYLSPSDDGYEVNSADSGYDGFNKLIVEPIPADHIGKDIPRKSASTIVPSEYDQIIKSGQYLSGDQLIERIPATYIGSGITKKAAATITPTKNKQTISAGQYLEGAQTIDPIPSEYIIPSGDFTISENGTFDVSNFINAIVNVPAGIVPIGNLTSSVLTRASDSGNHKLVIPAGYYVEKEFSVAEWRCGQTTGSGTSGGSFTIPYAAIGWVPSWTAIVLNTSVSNITANTVLAYISSPSTAISIYIGSSSLSSNSYVLKTGSAVANFNSSGVTFPAISGVKYLAKNYRWLVAR